jgi:hypothetical protein
MSNAAPFRVWPRVVAQRSILSVAEQDHLSIYRHFAADPTFWGLEIRFYRADPDILVCTNHINMLFLDGPYGIPKARPMGTRFTKIENEILAELTRARTDSFHTAVKQVVRPAPVVADFDRDRSISITLTRAGFFVSHLGIRDVETNVKFRQTDWTAHALRDRDLSPEDHTARAEDLSHGHFGSSCLTAIIKQVPQSGHARLAENTRMRTQIGYQLARLSRMTSATFDIHPDWDGITRLPARA